MRKNLWISLTLALFVAGLFALLEQRRGAYFNNPQVDLDRVAPSRKRTTTTPEDQIS